MSLSEPWERHFLIGVDDRFASNGPYDELLGPYGLLAEQIASTAEDFLGRMTAD